MSDTKDPNIRGGLPSASSFARVIQCPGSENLIRSIPRAEMDALRPKEDDEAADRGTLIHAAREKLSDADLDTEDAEIYRQGIEYERQLVTNWMDYYGLTTADIEEGPREERLWLRDSELNPLGSGQMDCHYLARRRHLALIIDWKGLYSTRVPNTKHSAQLRFQALLLWQNQDDERDLETIRVAYDRAMLKAAVSVGDFTDYTLQDLKYSLQLTEFQLWWSRQPDAPLVPGPECHFCPAKAWCRTGGAWSLIPSVELRQDGQASVLSPDPEELVAKMQPDDLKKLWQFKGLITKILDASVARLKAMPDDALFALGLERSKGRKLDPITDALGVWKYLESKGWTVEERLACIEWSKGKIGEAIGRREGIAKKYQSDRVSEEFDAYIERKRAEEGLKLYKGI